MQCVSVGGQERQDVPVLVAHAWNAHTLVVCIVGTIRSYPILSSAILVARQTMRNLLHATQQKPNSHVLISAWAGSDTGEGGGGGRGGVLGMESRPFIYFAKFFTIHPQ